MNLNCRQNFYRNLSLKIDTPDFLEPSQGIAVACSGGVDSMVLAHKLLQNLKSWEQKKLCIIHVNYQLRAVDADLDQKCVERFCDLTNIDCHIHKASTPPETGIQAWARRVRYQQFEMLANAGWVIALAHHLDDVSENVLLRLSRGTSYGHMAGMRVWSSPYWRPFLHLSKQDIRDYASKESIEFREDISNQSSFYTRNKIRNETLPNLETCYPNASKRIARTALNAQEVSDWLRAPFIGRKSLDFEEISHFPVAVALEAIQTVIAGQQQWISDSILKSVYHSMQSNTKSCWTRPDGTRILAAKGQINLDS